MSKKMHERLKLHKISKKALGIFALVIVGIGIAGGVTFAKYYANNSNKGVTAAANYYFSSDVLDDALNKEENPEIGDEEWKDVYNTDAWDGQNDYSFKMKIQNYQNQLLYNSDNLNIEYEITFELLKDDGKIYTVAYGSDEPKALNKGQKITYNETIKGGTAKADTFTVMFPKPEEVTDDYKSAGVRVVAKITGPDFLANTNTTIGAVLHVGIVKADYNLEGKFEFFDSYKSDTDWTDEGSKAAVNSMAAFPYTITYTPGDDNAAHDITISWNSSQLELNKFDEHYGQVTTEYGKSTLKVTMQPKEQLELVFYRADGFELETLKPEDFYYHLVTLDDPLAPKTDEID